MSSTQHTKKQIVPGAGNGLFTTVAVREGQEIFFVDHPLAYALDAPRLQDTCSNCLRKATDDGDISTPEVKLRRCMGCKVAKYCGEVGILQVFSFNPCASEILHKWERSWRSHFGAC